MVPSSRKNLIIAILGAAVATIGIVATRRSIVNLFGKVVDAGKELAFAASLPARARAYSDLILRVAREEGVDPYLIFALGDRESNWGETLKPKGPAGTGDWTPRKWGPSPMPPDGLGWGRGLMQIDYANALKVDWRDPLKNIRAGTKILKGNLAFFSGRSKIKGITDGQLVSIDESADRFGVAPGVYRDPRPLTGKPLWDAAIAAYNTGAGNVLMAIAVGKPAQFTTTGGDYVADVTNRGTIAAAKLA